MRRTSGGPASNTSGSRPVAAATRANSSGGRHRLGERRAAPDPGERHVLARAERAGEQRVVADLGVGVQRQVVRGEGEVVLEQRAQPLRQPRGEPDGLEAPEQAVMDQDELRLLRDGPLEQRALGGHAGHDALDVPLAGDLESVRAEVLERVRGQ